MSSKRISAALLFLTGVLLLIFPSRKAFAAESISYVRLELSYSPVVSGFDFSSIYMDSYQKEFDYSFQYETSQDTYRAGDAFPVTVTLSAEDGYSFIDIKQASCKLNDTTASSIEILEAGRILKCAFELPALCMILPVPENLYLKSDGTAGWDPVPEADSYEITVQYINDMGGRSISTAQEIRTTKADLSNIMYNQPNDYVYAVHARSDKYWLLDSDDADLPVSDSVLVTWEDIGYPDSVIWDDGFIHPDMTDDIARNVVLKIKGKGYYINGDGIREAGWKLVQGNYYYFDPKDSCMVHGLKEVDGKNYYFDPDIGIMLTGFVNVDGKEMFFCETGHAATGWTRYKDRIYYINSTGERNFSQLIDRKGRSYIFDPGDGHLILP